MGKIVLAYLICIYLVVFLGPVFVHQSPTATNPLAAMMPPGDGHLLGTDELGRDEFARLLAGGRITLTVGVAAMALAVLVGGTLGAVAGFFGGWAETVIMRVVDMMLSIPSFFLILVEITSFGHSPAVIVIVVGLTYWPQIARVVYAEVLKWRTSTLVEAEITIGAGPWRILRRHVLPQTFSSVIVLATLGIGWSILAESGLSYLGLGIQPPLASWGSMLQNSQSYIWTDPVLGIYPGVLIFLTVLAFSLLGEVLRDVFDPRTQGSR
ncbi:ABC transporter permease [Alicyclobacillus macrosporangiidus]|uniref:ABC transporter permease n=1 Tax=Alicyclobacillus macrosporangiidus TaxID=392015 RepID=UPI0018CC1FDB|nr:ABC transporter permease [Alicyclobacillus macrosporangiidus]